MSSVISERYLSGTLTAGENYIPPTILVLSHFILSSHSLHCDAAFQLTAWSNESRHASKNQTKLHPSYSTFMLRSERHADAVYLSQTNKQCGPFFWPQRECKRPFKWQSHMTSWVKFTRWADACWAFKRRKKTTTTKKKKKPQYHFHELLWNRITGQQIWQRRANQSPGICEMVHIASRSGPLFMASSPEFCSQVRRNPAVSPQQCWKTDFLQQDCPWTVTGFHQCVLEVRGYAATSQAAQAT